MVARVFVRIRSSWPRASSRARFGLALVGTVKILAAETDILKFSEPEENVKTLRMRPFRKLPLTARCAAGCRRARGTGK